MWRNLLLELGMIALPFVIYFVYRSFLMRHKRDEGEMFSPVPYHRLLAAGLGLALLLFVAAALLGVGGRDGHYVPAHMQDGKLVPGQVVPHNPDATPTQTTDQKGEPQ